MAIDGTWKVTVQSPMGAQQADLTQAQVERVDLDEREERRRGRQTGAEDELGQQQMAQPRR